MSGSAERTVAIIGTGCSGAMTAIHFLEHLQGPRVRLLLIDPNTDVGRGVAYAKRAFPYLVNAPASTMSIRSQDSLDFVRYLQEQDPIASVEDFPTRERFGDYVQTRLLAAIEAARDRCTVERISRAVVSLARHSSANGWQLVLDDSSVLAAGEIVLALGNPTPAPVQTLGAEIDCDGIQDPWQATELDTDARTILVLGTGLTMVDTVCALLAASPTLRIHALSRRGLLPLNQTDTRPASFDDARLATVLQDSGSLRELLREVVQAGRRANAAGGDWRRVIISVRQQAGALWGRLSLPDRRRFLRHVRPYWDIHRHRFPAPVWNTVQTLISSGRLTLHAGRLTRLEKVDGGFAAQWRTRATAELRELIVDHVINCTGPDYQIARSPDPLWRHLLREGMIVPDALHLGLHTSALGEVIDTHGQTVPGLYYVGPMRRAMCWESTAVAELRVQAESLARQLASA
jgi:uncharacterized NAD(P)/FAD-binding protein YdhS